MIVVYPLNGRATRVARSPSLSSPPWAARVERLIHAGPARRVLKLGARTGSDEPTDRVVVTD